MIFYFLCDTRALVSRWWEIAAVGRDRSKAEDHVTSLFFLPRVPGVWLVRVYDSQQTTLRSLVGKHPQCQEQLLLWQPSKEPKHRRKIVLHSYSLQGLAALLEPFFAFPNRELFQESGNLHMPTCACHKRELSTIRMLMKLGKDRRDKAHITQQKQKEQYL